jgi:ABC-2 type transport system ATP-binding protein
MDADVPMSAEVVEIDRVVKTFGSVTALDGVSFTVPRGQVCGVLGPNGAGKTTLFRLLMGILKATQGRVRIAGLDAFADRVAVKRLIGFLPDEPTFYSYLTGREILQLSAGMHGLPVAAALAGLEPVIRALQMTDHLEQFAEDYSRGMKKKLGLLLALVHQPQLLVLDEPTNGLDVEGTRAFYDLIQLATARGATVLFSSHLMDQIARSCSHVVIVDHGRVMAHRPLAELRQEHGDLDLEAIFIALTTAASRPDADRTAVP